MHSDQSLERWIWPISCRKCWCTPSQKWLLKPLVSFQLVMGWRKARDMSHTRLLACGVKKVGKVTHLLPTWLPYHLQEKHSLKMWRGHIFRQLYGDQSASTQSYAQRNMDGRGTQQTRHYAPFLYQTTQNRPLTTFWKLSNVDAKLIPPVAPRNAVVGSKDYLSPCFAHVLVWGVRDFSSPLWTIGI